MFQEVIDLEFSVCQRQLAAPALISQSSFQGLIEVVIGSPGPGPRGLPGPSPLGLRESGWPSLPASQPLQALASLYSPCQDGGGLEWSALGWEVGAKSQMSQCQRAHEKCPSILTRAWLVFHYYE